MSRAVAVCRPVLLASVRFACDSSRGDFSRWPARVLAKQVGTQVLLVVVPDEMLYDHRTMEVEVGSGFEPPVVGVPGFILATGSVLKLRVLLDTVLGKCWQQSTDSS